MSTLTASQPTVEDRAPQIRTEACPQCGGPVESADKFCPSCGSRRPEADAVHAEVVPQRHLRCKNCGAEVAIDPNQRSYVCPFCDSSYVIEFNPEETGRQAPEFVIGFAVTPQQAMEEFRRWLGRNSWFRPGDLAASSFEDKLKGVYLPFWSFSMLARSRWSASIGEHWYRTETYTTQENGKTVTKTRQVQETEWWDLSGGHHEYYSGYLVSGSRGLSQADSQRIQPFHLAALRRYEPYWLAGWLNEEYSVGRDDALRICQEEFCRREQNAVASFLPGDTHSNLAVETGFEDVNSDLALLPVYLLTYRYRNKVYRFLMNGQTGKTAGNKPMSGWRIGIAVGVVLAIIALLILLVGLMR
jgi:hypothetical protein